MKVAIHYEELGIGGTHIVTAKSVDAAIKTFCKAYGHFGHMQAEVDGKKRAINNGTMASHMARLIESERRRMFEDMRTACVFNEDDPCSHYRNATGKCKLDDCPMVSGGRLKDAIRPMR